MTPEQIEACFTRDDGRFAFARWGRPIVPVVFHGGHDIMPLGSLKARPGTIRVRFGAPISTNGVKENQARDFADKLRESVVAIYEDLRQLSREANAGTSA